MPYKDIEKRREAQRRWYKKNKETHNKKRTEVRLKHRGDLSALLKPYTIRRVQPKHVWLRPAAGRVVPVFRVEETLQILGISRPTLLRWEKESLIPTRTFGNGFTHHQVKLLIDLAKAISENTHGRAGIDTQAIQKQIDHTYASWTAISNYPAIQKAPAD